MVQKLAPHSTLTLPSTLTPKPSASEATHDHPTANTRFPPPAAPVDVLIIGGVIYCYNQAIRYQNNLGYIEAVSALRIAAVYGFSIAAFQAPFDVVRLAGVVMITLGVLAVIGTLRPSREEIRLDWLRWALASSAFFAALTIFVRYATDAGVRGEIALVVVVIVTGGCFWPPAPGIVPRCASPRRISRWW